MNKALFILVLIMGTGICVEAQVWQSVQKDSSSFPVAWEGTWTGTLQIFFPGVSPREVPMRLEIIPEDSLSWSWTLIYQADHTEDRRPYRLLPVNPEKGRWQIDEQNGIVLGGQVFGPVFVSRFEVGGQLLLARYGLEDDAIRFEILTGGMDFEMTGGLQDGENPLEATPEVKWYNLNVYQKAILQRSYD